MTRIASLIAIAPDEGRERVLDAALEGWRVAQLLNGYRVIPTLFFYSSSNSPKADSVNLRFLQHVMGVRMMCKAVFL